MWKIIKLLNSLLLVTLWSSASSKPQRYDSYHYQGADVYRWQNVEPFYGFESHRRPHRPEVHLPFPSPPRIRPEAVPFDFSAFDSNEFDYGPGLSHIPPKPKPKGEINVTVERMGGFGGTGDTRGYGAYEYKSADDMLYATPYTDYYNAPQKQDEDHYNFHQLQDV